MFLLGTILGLFIGMLLMACISVNKINERQSLVNEGRQALTNAEDEVVCLVKENKTLYGENKVLRFENEELREVIISIYNLSTSNTYNNEKTILAKIKEVIADAQINQ